MWVMQESEKIKGNVSIESQNSGSVLLQQYILEVSEDQMFVIKINAQVVESRSFL